MQRLEAMVRDRRNSVRRSSNVGKTLNSTARRICTADRNTTIDAAIEHANSTSSMAAGKGMSMIKITLIAPNGRMYSRKRNGMPRSEEIGIARDGELIV